MYEICEIYHKYFKFFDTSQIKSNQVETIEQEEAIQESESFDYIIDNAPEHENWHISVLESKLKQGKDKLMELYVCINELYNNLCQLEKIYLPSTRHVNVSNFEDEKDSIDPNFVEAVELLRKCGFINAEYTSRRRETLQYRKNHGRAQN